MSLSVSLRQNLERENPTPLFVTLEKNKVKLSDHLVKLLKIGKLYDEHDDFQTVVKKTQEAWLATNQGKGGIERTDLKDDLSEESNREDVIETARQMGLFNERRCSLLHYDYGICLGAFLDGVRSRISDLVNVWEKDDVTFDSLVFLTGERDLRIGDGKEDDVKKLCDEKGYSLFKKGWKLPDGAKYKTEYDMVKLVWDQTELPQGMAEALKGKVTFVNAPRGDNQRPGTKETYAEWVKSNPPEGSLLAPSYPLIWAYQDLAGRNALGKKYALHTTAPAATKELLEKNQHRIVSLVHDTVAKCLFEISNSDWVKALSTN